MLAKSKRVMWRKSNGPRRHAQSVLPRAEVCNSLLHYLSGQPGRRRGRSRFILTVWATLLRLTLCERGVHAAIRRNLVFEEKVHD